MTQSLRMPRVWRSPRPRAKAAGLSLIELLVAVTIGGILIFGATQVYVDSRNMYEVNESSARLQETARYAISVIEPDIRMSNYWGFVKGAGVITTTAGGPDTCGASYARNLSNNLEGASNTYSLGCAAFGNGAVASADTLTVRRASTAVAAAEASRLQICSTRVMGRLMDDGGACPATPAGQINNLLVNAYYVSRDSTQANGLPSLRRKALVGGAPGGLNFIDEEIIPGIEDLQVQFGVDPTGLSGTATHYVNPDDVPAGAQIVSVRIWLLVRAENPEVGFTDDRVYEYGDRDQGIGVTDDLNAAGAATRAYEPGDNFRRLLVSRTIQIRNALGT